jgi:AcrR family transcriptional regulator
MPLSNLIHREELIHLKINRSKQKVIDAASLLFFQKGFHGTSVRDIADEASVNVSLISYYFKSKQGLLEYAITQYYEIYLQKLEEIIQQTTGLSYLERLKQMIFTIIQYKQDNLQLSCTIHRELSLDSVFVRELTVTYLAKENHFIGTLFFNILKNEYVLDKEFLLMQLKGMLITPYLLHNEWKYQVIGNHSHKIFVRKYVDKVNDWLDFVEGNKDPT